MVAELTTDACGYGWGALLNRSAPARGFFSLTEQAEHIKIQELRAQDKALDCFPNVQGPSVLRLRQDRTVNVAVLKNRTTRSPALKVVLDCVVSKLTARYLRAKPTWLSSVANADAVKLSRDTDSADRHLRREVFLALDQASWPLTVDRFAVLQPQLELLLRLLCGQQLARATQQRGSPVVRLRAHARAQPPAVDDAQLPDIDRQHARRQGVPQACRRGSRLQVSQGLGPHRRRPHQLPAGSPRSPTRLPRARHRLPRRPHI